MSILKLIVLSIVVVGLVFACKMVAYTEQSVESSEAISNNEATKKKRRL